MAILGSNYDQQPNFKTKSRQGKSSRDIIHGENSQSMLNILNYCQVDQSDLNLGGSRKIDKLAIANLLRDSNTSEEEALSSKRRIRPFDTPDNVSPCSKHSLRQDTNATPKERDFSASALEFSIHEHSSIGENTNQDLKPVNKITQRNNVRFQSQQQERPGQSRALQSK
jgi:hypothetical protein